jgi:acyl-coenzyme A thioesterase PaaI-like protein
VNLLNPASGVRLVARGQVVKPGRTVMVCTGDVIAGQEGGIVHPVALMQATMMVVRDRTGIAD